MRGARLFAAALALLTLIPAARPALAQSAAEEGWVSQITPYLWAPGLGGDVRPFAGAPTLSFSKSISDVLEDSDGAFFLSAYARRGRLVVMGDLSWSSSSKSGLLPPGLPAEGGLKQRSLTLLAGWRAVSGERGTLDILAGARAWKVESSIQVAGGLFQAAPGRDFVDPILALRVNYSLAPDWSVILYGDIGLPGGGSDSTSQLLATVNYRLNEKLYLSAGYRALNVDYRSGGTLVDVTMAGPMLGVTWQF